MEGNGDIHHYGDFIEHEGCLYSNYSFNYNHDDAFNYNHDDNFLYTWQNAIKKENDIDYPEL